MQGVRAVGSKGRVLAVVALAGLVATATLAVAGSAAGPKRGGVLKVGRVADVITWDPVFVTDNMSIWAKLLVFQLLVRTSQNGKSVVPDLADHWSQSKDGKTVVGPPGKASRIDRFNKGPWKDVTDYRDPQGEVEKPHGQWNLLELVAQGDRVRHFVNGKLVNEGSEAFPSKGKILFQSEGAELFFRNIKLFPLKE